MSRPRPYPILLPHAAVALVILGAISLIGLARPSAAAPASAAEVSASTPAAGEDLASLAQGRTLQGFRLLNLYEHASGHVIGARFLYEPQGFVLDLLRIQSVPQAFVWIKTVPDSDRGEPHACEHLLLGKGRRGRYAAALEDMALAQSTAYTGQVRTCYHFNTSAGIETFYEVCEAKLQAFLQPDFSDEEIRREVCHLAVTSDPATGQLALEEKGTVYTEMVSSYEKPWYHFTRPLEEMVYGPDHPLLFSSGGDPAAMRAMTADDLWRFHRRTHRLSNMGMIVSLPAGIELEPFLGRLGQILDRCQPEGEANPDAAIRVTGYPATRPAPEGSRAIISYPSRNPEDPGYLLFAWPSDLTLDPGERLLLDLFLEGLAGGETSRLYELLIRSDTRLIDVGGSAVWGGFDSEAGHEVYLGLAGLDRRAIGETMVDSLRAIVRAEIRRLHDLPDGDPALAAFNAELKSRLIERRKQAERDLDSPPMFGFRSGPAGAWLSVLQDLEDEPGFRKPLLPRARYAAAESLLALDRNLWRDALERWRLVTRAPYAVGAAPGPEYLDREARAKEERLAAQLRALRERTGASDDQEALRRFQAEFDAATLALESAETNEALPRFISDPPLTLDDALDYRTGRLAIGIPWLAATFEAMNSSWIGLALRMDVLPESLLVYAPLLPATLTSLGVIYDGVALDYLAQRDRLRREVLGLDASFSTNPLTGRVELALTGQASSREEIPVVVDWMARSLLSPNLRRENLSRVVDVIDQGLIDLRNRMKGSEEDWVDDPAAAYRYQDDPLYLATSSFLTQTHLLQRLRWRFTDAGGAEDQRALSAWLRALGSEPRAAGPRALDREAASGLLAALAGAGEPPLPQSASEPLRAATRALSPAARALAREVAASLQSALAEIPDATLADDWADLCREAESDLLVSPDRALADLERALALLRHRSQARLTIVANSNDQPLALSTLVTALEPFPAEAPPRVPYRSGPRILERLRGREPGAQPVYAGLVHPSTRNGVLLFSARLGEANEPYDTSPEAVLQGLTARVYMGGGAHGLFMRTWAAGLAYSNGYGYNERTGRANYYAERCPDVAQTMRFVVEALRDTTVAPQADYAVAQVFGATRAASRYEARGAAMAADLTDGYTPERVRAYRQAILALRDRPGLEAALRERLEAVYGPVLIGYGEPLARSRDGVFFMIGPEEQFRSLESWIATAEGPQTVHRLYPRDFWLTL